MQRADSIKMLTALDPILFVLLLPIAYSTVLAFVFLRSADYAAANLDSRKNTQSPLLSSPFSRQLPLDVEYEEGHRVQRDLLRQYQLISKAQSKVKRKA